MPSAKHIVIKISDAGVVEAEKAGKPKGPPAIQAAYLARPS
jgi:hypothetical protein